MAPPPPVAWLGSWWAGDPDWSNPGDGNPVAQWDGDQGSGRHLTQATAGNRPTFRASTAAFNNKPTVEFGVNDQDLIYDAGATIVDPSASHYTSVVVVGSIGTVAAYATLAALLGSGFPQVFGNHASNKFGSYWDGGIDSTVDRDTNPHLFVWRCRASNDNASTIAVDQAAPVGGNQRFATSATGIRLNNASNGNPGGGHRAFVGLFDGDVTTDPEWEAFREWVQTEYDIDLGYSSGVTVELGQATETDTAHPLSGFAPTIVLGQALETDTAQPITAGEHPSIDLWYGTTLDAGVHGRPQQWVQIQGRALDAEDTVPVTPASFTVNGGASQPLTVHDNITTTNPRLHAVGDFLVEIDRDTLDPGPNTVVITVVDSDGFSTQATVTVDYTAGVTWPIPDTVTWAGVTNPTDRVAVVDGRWEVDADGITNLDDAYDRCFAVGDVTWVNYEIEVPVTVHSIAGIGGVGFLHRWTGHTENDPHTPGDQPRVGWQPSGCLTWYRDLFHAGGPRLKVAKADETLINELDQQLVEGSTYVFRVRVERVGLEDHYTFDVWPASGVPGDGWSVSAVDAAPDADTGSVLFLAHRSLATFGDITVRALAGAPVELGQPAETDTAQPLAAAKVVNLGTALEVDTATAVARAKARPVGQATTADVALPAGRAKVATTGRALEVDSAHPIGTGTTVGLSQAAEADTTSPIGAAKVVALGQAVEVDTGLPLAGGVSGVNLGTAVEADTALPIARAKAPAPGPAVETDTATGPTATKAASLAAAAESAQAAPLAIGKVVALGTALEADSAAAVALTARIVLTVAAEVDVALGLLSLGGVVDELDHGPARLALRHLATLEPSPHGARLSPPELTP